LFLVDKVRKIGTCWIGTIDAPCKMSDNSGVRKAGSGCRCI